MTAVVLLEWVGWLQEMGRSAHDALAELSDSGSASMEEEELEQWAASELDGLATQGLRRWRLDQFVALGFDCGQAARMADAPVDLGQARKLIALGCPLETASRILF